MSFPAEYIELFDRFLDGNLSEEEQISFNRQLEEDPVFAETFDAYLVARGAIGLNGLQEDLRSVMKEEKVKIRSIMRFFPYGIAAAVLCLLMITIPFLNNSSEDVFGQYFETYPYYFTERGEGESDPIQKAILAYRQGSFEEAKPYFEQSVKNDTSFFYQGVNHLALKEADQALIAFSQVRGNSIFGEELLWYQALAHILQGETEIAITILKKIPIGSTRRESALALLNELEE